MLMMPWIGLLPFLIEIGLPFLVLVEVVVGKVKGGMDTGERTYFEFLSYNVISLHDQTIIKET